MADQKEKFFNQLGAIPKQMLMLVGIVAGVAVIGIVLISVFSKPPPPPPEPEEPPLVFEVELGDVKFNIEEVVDMGNLLLGEERTVGQKRGDLSTTERFILVTVGAENIGTENIRSGDWLVEGLVDSVGRKFYYTRQADPWLPLESSCNSILKPGFSPTYCSKIYEVANVATGLQVKVNYKNRESAFLDLGI